MAQMDKHADALTVYSQEYREVGTLNQYYYIDNKIENIWLLNIIEDERNRRVNYLEKYHIDKRGHIKLDSTISCKYNVVYFERNKTVATCSKI